MEFLLEPEVVFLNHGSFGACPREVFDEYQRWQRKLEAQPVRFLQREFGDLLAEARLVLSGYVGAHPDEVVFVPNPTFAVNEIARSLRLGSQDEVLLSDQEYGGCSRAWQFMSQKDGYRLVTRDVDLPVSSDAAIVDELWGGVSDNTRVIFLSHITSPTALTLPVAEICQRAREQDILTVIDGAHAPGQIDLNLMDLSADFYVATCHKWMCAPKGSAFLYARRNVQHLIEPLVVGWGWGDQRTVNAGCDFLDYHEWLGTNDPAAYLTVPAAIRFQRRNNWQEVQRQCHDLAVQVVDRASRLPGMNRVHEDSFFQQMALIELVHGGSSQTVQRRLYDEFRVEVPAIDWKSRLFIRVSLQAYNSQQDVDMLIDALKSIVTQEV